MLRTVILIVTLLLAGLIASGCEDNNPAKQYGETLTDAYHEAPVAVQAANLEILKRSISGFQASNDRYPGDLAELGRFANMQLDPAVYDYNPSTGKISLTTP